MEHGTKFRILYLYQFLMQNSDADHPFSTNELIQALHDRHGIDVNRNTLGKDLDIMHESGLQIEVIRSTQNKYYYDGQILDAPELKLLIDAVSSSKFITEQKSEQLINKLLTLVPVHSAVKLRRHIYASDRVKSDNERGYYIVDAINEAIDTRHKISFCYTDFDVNKNRYVSNDGKPYTVSPYTLMWDGDYYYLRGYCDERQAMRTFRLDRIEKQPDVLRDAALPKPENYSIAEYSKSVFRMFDTDEPVEVTLLCSASNMKVIIDNFGIDADTTPVDAEHFVAKVKVCTSPTFYRWIFGFGGKIKILGPDRIIDDYLKMCRDTLAAYSN
ncbi:WYL domain-containing protein [Butyricicoccus sp. BIOML-A1]|nr:WYL domain-containing protein [Butyricicoccus sp. BIOML-A1]MZT25972.1 WYL domain-containing protein [Butyricicoccus sp. BIOML-A1]